MPETDTETETYLVKICGITNVEDAQQAVHSGADYLGLIFVEGSPRAVTVAQAQEIAKVVEGSPVQLVGVFQNATQQTIERVLDSLKLDVIQLHGEEPKELCASLARRARLIKAIRTPEDAYDYAEFVDLFLLDRPKNSEAAPHAWLAETAADAALDSMPAFLFAGGLTDLTLSSAIDKLGGCSGLKGFDVASGVETAPGKKDAQKVQSFCTTAKGGGKHALSR